MSFVVDYTQPNSDTRPLLNWHQAQELLDAGFAVELPEFKGWWFKKNDITYVRTRDGELLTSPWIERYSDRNDWRVSMQVMDFSQAARFAWAGIDCTRLPLSIKEVPTSARLSRHRQLYPMNQEMMLYSYQMYNDDSFQKALLSEDWRMVERDALLPGEG